MPRKEVSSKESVDVENFEPYPWFIQVGRDEGKLIVIISLCKGKQTAVVVNVKILADLTKPTVHDIIQSVRDKGDMK